MRRIQDNDKINHRISDAYESKKYIVSHRSIYQPFYSVNAGYYAQEVYKCSGAMPLVGRGMFIHATAAHVNRLIGIELLAEL
jgi:hypothetical protein